MEEFINRPISSHQIEDFFRGNTFSDSPFYVLQIEELKELELSELFQGNRTFEIFFVTNPKNEVGHFVAMILMDESTIELFDPAGTEKTDDVMDYLHHIKEFSDRENIKVIYNKDSFQSKYSSTCHRAVIFRCMLSFLDLDEFKKVVDNKNFKDHDHFFASVVRY